MVPTTRSRGASAPTNSNDADLGSHKTTLISATKKSKSKNDRVYRKAPPKPELQQLHFPAKRKTVRAKKTRHSLPNPSRTTATNKQEDDEDRKQKTLTQMRWTDIVPSTLCSDDNGLDDTDSDERKRFEVDLMTEGSDRRASASVPSKSTSAEKRKKGNKGKQKLLVKQPTEAKQTTSRGRKRRKTTGDLELELELECEVNQDEERVSRSKYHTQTLTQMPSWSASAEEVIGDSDEELGAGFDDDFLVGARFDSPTPPSKKRKRSSPMPEQEATVPQPALSQPPKSTAASSVVPETPNRQRATRTEIPFSQPSPFTPNLDVGPRYWSPLGTHGVDRTPLKERSTNVDAPTPTVRKRSRSEIPDSWSTVNGGLPSSNGARSAKRVPLEEIHFADESAELGDDNRGENIGLAARQDGDKTPQRTMDDVILDSDDEFEGFLDDGGDDDDDIEAPCTSSPQKRVPTESGGEGSPNEQSILEQTDDETSVEEARGPTPLEANTTTASTPVSHTSARLNGTPERFAEAVNADADDIVTSTPSEQITAPGEVTSNGLHIDTPNREHQSEIVELEGEEVVTPTPSVRDPATRQPSTHSSTAHRSPTLDPLSQEEEMTTPTQTMRKTATQEQSPYSRTAHKAGPGPVAEDDETEPETPLHPRRRPSSSSAVDKETPLSSPQKTSPAMLPVSQLGYKSQAFESQRVPFEVIQQMAPQTDRSDVIVSADSDEVKHIIDGTCTHIFRDFRIPRHVVRIWIYITAPVCQLKYMAAISDWKIPGDLKDEDQGIGTRDFNANMSTKYANELLQVYQLNNSVSLERMKEDGWVEQTPLMTSFKYIPPAPLGALMGNLRCALFEEHGNESQSQSQSQSQSMGTVTVSQELAEQLRSDIEHSTQLVRGKLLSSSTKQRSQTRYAEEQHDDEQLVVPSSQGAMEDGVRATPLRTRFSSKKQVVFAKRKASPPRSQHSMVQIDDSPPAARQSSQRSQRIIQSTVHASQATTLSALSQSQQHDRTVEYCTISDSPLPAARLSAADKPSSLPMVVDDSPIQMRTGMSSGPGVHTQSSLGLGMLLGSSSQGFGLAGIGGEDDSLMDDSRIRLPPGVEEVVWDSEGE